MSYQVLARKWRPRTFRELVGQQHVLQALVNALDHNRLHHAYLFTGTRGVGKTTIARILAKCLNCESGVSSEPCGQCGACVEIAEGRFVDLIEVDAASRTKVEDTRELLENVQYAPTRGRYKVYLIDEVHMLSSHSFNALLKTLEEPPPHVKFLLATTDPQKLPVTILSRCLQFHLKNMDPERIVGHLQYVLEQEMVPFEESALWQLGRAADGSMRDAMSLADQAIAFGGGKVAESEVRSMLGTIDQNLVYRVLEALVSGQGQAVLQAVDELSEHAPDYSGALAELLSSLHRIAIAQALPEAVDNSRGDQQQILTLAQQLPPEDVQLFYQTALMGRRDLPMSPDMRAGFEMVLLRMMAFRPQGVHSVPTQPLPQSTPTAPQAVAEPEPAPQQVAPPAPQPQTPQEPQVQQEHQPQEPQPEAEVKSEPVAEEPQQVQPESQTEHARPVEHVSEPSAPEPPAPEPPSVNETAQAGEAQKRSLSPEEMTAMGLQPARQVPVVEKPEVKSPELKKIPLSAMTPDRWIELYAGLGVGGVLQSTVSNCLLQHIEGDQWYFLLDHNHSTLYDEGHQGRLSDLLGQYFGQPMTAVIELGTVTAETPAACAIRIRQEQHAYALNAMNTDPVVQQLLQQFEGVLDEESVRPILDE
ncbi:DNA polymerase III subunit gamma/tau [Pseudomaricurvus sp.]|uniref:DNA polymerase III subunit gamma/tau n=1 Tax=Pseudomaricurvus sp. TaxID=2004510 RepID=UPI003F6BEEB6